MTTHPDAITPYTSRDLFLYAPAPMLVLAPDAPRFTIIDVNEAYLAAVARSRGDLIGRGVFEAMPGDPDNPRATGVANLRASLERAIASRQPDRMALQKYDIPFEGGFEARWWDPVNTPLLDKDGAVTAVIHHVEDATARKRATMRQARTEALLLAQNRVLELAIADVPLSEALDGLVRIAEALSTSGMLGSILVLDHDGAILRHGAAPSLPVAYNAIVDGLAVGPDVGSCGAAIHRGIPVYAEDIATDPLWTGYRDVALAQGLRACWSTPIKAVTGEILGTFAMYFREPRRPNDADLEFVDFIIRSAALLIERKEAENRLRESEARFRNVADNAPVMMWVTDPTGYCTYLNRGWYEYTGQDLHAGEAYGWLDAVHPDDRPLAEAAFVSANAEQRHYRVDFRLRRADGRYRWALDAAAPRFGEDGQYLGYVGSVIDIDERREAEERLRESEERLRLATENADVGFWDVDVINDILIWPPRVKAMFGISSHVDVSMADFYDGLHPDDRDATTQVFEAAIDPARRAIYDVEYRTIGKEDGLVRWIAARGRGLFDAAGACYRVVGTAVDITSRKRDEAELRILNERLEQRVAEEVAHRDAAQEQLRHSQKVEAVGQLTGSVAHDFNNLLTVIRGSVDLLRRPSISEEKKARYIDAISDTTDRATRLTGQLLAFARRQTLKPQVFAPAESIQSLGDMLQTLAGSRIAITLELDPDACCVNADPSQFDTAIVNMAVNARDAMSGEGALTIRLERLDRLPEIRMHPAVEAPFLAVSIQDTGSGIPNDLLDRIFEPFFTTKGVGHGTGLGLSQVFGFAKQSGGEIAVESEVGRGTTFTLYLPQVDPVEDGPRLSTQARRLLPPGSRILVVEDNEEVGNFASQALQELGYQPSWVTTGDEALRKLAAADHAYDVIFTDVVMPGMTGIELANEIHRTHPHLPVLLTSGYSHVLAEQGPGGFDLLRKPYSLEDLARALNTVRTPEPVGSS